MPCDTISQAEVLFGKDTNRKMLSAAMLALGIGESEWSLVEQGNGKPAKLTFPTYGGVTSAMVQREYSKEIVATAAKQFGWKMTTQPDGKIVVQKGTF